MIRLFITTFEFFYHDMQFRRFAIVTSSWLIDPILFREPSWLQWHCPPDDSAYQLNIAGFVEVYCFVFMVE